MTKLDSKIIAKIKKKALQDQAKRQDVRYKKTMGFFAAKGFLRTNEEMMLMPNAQLQLADVLWVGEEVEPRVLEVLPAALIRLPQHFLGDINHFPNLARVVQALRERRLEGPDFYKMPYQKLLPWLSLRLRDKRTKTFDHKRIVKTFRLRPEILNVLREKALTSRSTETDVIENLIWRSR